MLTESNPMTGAGLVERSATPRGPAFRLESAIVLGGVLVAATVAAVTHQTASTFERDQPLTGAVLQITQQVTLSKLWLEEAIDDEVPVDVERDVYGNLEKASASCATLEAAEGNRPGSAQPPIADAEVRASVTVLCEDIVALQQLTEVRIAQPKADAGSPDDRSYNSTYRTFLTRSDHVLDLVQQSVEQDQARVAVVYRWLSLIPFIASTVLALMVWTHRRRTAKANQELAKLAAIVNSSPDAILSKSTDGIVLAWNPGAERLYGWGAEEIVGRDAGVLVPDHLQAEEEAMMERVRAGERVMSESERLRKDGSVVPVALTVSPVYRGGAVTGIASIQQDITERRAKDVELVAAREKALESSRLKSEFLATMSHEIRTPLNGVIGLTHLLLETPLDETQRRYAEGVQGAGGALLTVIGDILDLSKLEAGKVDLDVGPFQPRRLVEEVAALLAPPAQAKGLELMAFCLPNVPEVLVGDAGRIRQVLLNLTSNAVKFTASGEVVIKVRSVTQESGTALVRLEVTDTGIGIGAADVDRIFETFAQADASTTRRFGGTGLGLAISRRLIEAMGGEIGVESEEGTGSTFWSQVPLPVGASAAGQVAPAAYDVVAGTRVLVVDDNATNRLVLESQLASWQLSPQGVEDGAQALALLRQAATAATPYRVAVLDMCMPGMDGLELARRISADQALSTTRLILLTSTIQIDGEELRGAGVSEWLSKPVASSQLYEGLVRLLTRDAAEASPFQPEPLPGLPESSLGRVLVVDDNQVNQMVAEAMLSRLGYQVDIAADGVEALDAISTTRYSAVLMDCHMPVMDGFQATEEIRRRQPDTYRLPIIAMTAGTMSGDRERCLAAGMDDYISKPVNVAALGETLMRWVRARPG